MAVTQTVIRKSFYGTEFKNGFEKMTIDSKTGVHFHLRTPLVTFFNRKSVLESI